MFHYLTETSVTSWQRCGEFGTEKNASSIFSSSCRTLSRAAEEIFAILPKISLSL